MPNAAGAPTNPELQHYEKLLRKAEEALRVIQSKPFKTDQFETLHKEVETIYKEFSNPYIWCSGQNSWSPLFDIPNALKNAANTLNLGLIGALQEELTNARKNLSQMKRVQAEANPIRLVLSYMQGKRD